MAMKYARRWVPVRACSVLNLLVILTSTGWAEETQAIPIAQPENGSPAPGSEHSRTDTRPLVRPFLVGDLALESFVGLALGIGRFSCNYCLPADTGSIMVMDVVGQRRLTHGLAMFARVGVLRRTTPHTYPAPITLGIRHSFRKSRTRTILGIAGSVSIPMPDGGGNGGATVRAAHTIRDDTSLYAMFVGTARLEFDIRFALDRMMVQGQTAFLVQSIENDGLAGSVRAAGALGVRVVDDLFAFAEVSTRVYRSGEWCYTCGVEGAFKRLHLSTGFRARWSRISVGGHLLVPLLDEDAEANETASAPSVTAAAEWLW